MASGELFNTIFGSCVLEVLTPDTSISFPDDVVVDDWLASVKQPQAERKQAFFDEQLNLLLVMYIQPPSNTAPEERSPPRSLVELLSHVQISLEATYISQTPSQSVPETSSLAPPRTSSALKGCPPSLHPSIFPPHTPNPIPSTTESDRKYVQSEGIPLFSDIWGTKKAQDGSNERFALFFSETRQRWIAVYELSFVVTYLRLPFSDPLLCLTASATLRGKALSPSQSTHPLVAYLVETGMISRLESGAATDDEEDEEDEEEQDTGFEEINLLDGLTLGSISSDSEPLHLPSTRLGNAARQRLFSLPPVPPAQTPPSSKLTPNHVLRKSYRKILQTVSGFRVRMRTVFVPHVLLPKNYGQSTRDYDDLDGGNEEWEAGNNERTVVLCVEVENSGESGPATGFSLERLEVKIGGEGATTRLIGWGECAFDSDVENRLFPLRIGSMEQYNLLYVVSFWSTPDDQDNVLFTSRGGSGGGELQRAVTITVHGRPYLTGEIRDGNSTSSYPTQTFSSRWNCILDLSSKPREEPMGIHESPAGRSALPEPPSPFPGRTALSSLFSRAPPMPTPQAIAGKRNTLPGSITAIRAVNSSANSHLSLPPRGYPTGPTALPATAGTYAPPSVALQAFNNRPVSAAFGTTPSPLGGPAGFNINTSPPEMPAQAFVAPPTPAYPAFPPGAATNTPHVQALGSRQGYSGPSIEIRRERGTSAVPQTPLPTMLNTQLDGRHGPAPVPSGEPVVVSVGLSSPESDEGSAYGQSKIYPSEQFTLDIFVYNQSSWTRRFEISYPNADRRRRRTEQSKTASDSKGKGIPEELRALITAPGILPLQNRVRVGPLKPSTCQSVRMDFLAISPGVHSVDTLTLTDVETGYAVNLRSVMDIVVHERTVEEKEEKDP